MVSIFRITAILEGLSAILLFGVAMPMKYFFESPALIRPVGMAHGVLFIAYLAFLFFLKKSRGWDDVLVAKAALASIVPLGTFIIDRQLFPKEK